MNEEDIAREPKAQEGSTTSAKRPKQAKKSTQKNAKKKKQTQVEEGLHEDMQSSSDASDTSTVSGAAEATDWKDKYVRLYAEFENFRRRTQKERHEWVQGTKKTLILDFLPVLDDLERAQKSFAKTKDPEALTEGLDLICHKFLHILHEEGFHTLPSQKGDNFDLEKHEAISQIPSPTAELRGKVIEVIEKGYTFKEAVVRYAKVITAGHE